MMRRYPIGPLLAPGASAAAGSGGACTDGKCRVLVVDDNVDAATTLCDALELLACETLAAHDGPDAIAAAKRFSPDLALIDIGLPGMNGHEVAAAIHAILPDARLVAVSGHAPEDDPHRAATSEFSRHIVKPITLSVVREILAELT